jgi:hypothetical protein
MRFSAVSNNEELLIRQQNLRDLQNRIAITEDLQRILINPNQNENIFQQDIQGILARLENVRR